MLENWLYGRAAASVVKGTEHTLAQLCTYRPAPQIDPAEQKQDL